MDRDLEFVDLSIQSVINRKELKAINFFWIGFLIYTVSFTLSKVLIAKYNANYNILHFFQVIAILIFVISAIFLVKFKFENKYLRFVYLLYIVWSCTIIARGFDFNVDFFKDILFDESFGVFPYLAPLILLFPQNLMFYKKAFKVILILSVSYIVFDIVFIQDLLVRDVYNEASQTIVDHLSKNLGLSCGFLFLIYKYHSKNIKWVALGILIISIFFVIIRARRALIFILSAPLIITYIFYLLDSKAKIIIIILSILFGYLFIMYGLKAFNESKIFYSVKERGTVDSRSAVEDCFYDDMKTNDWIIGRGISGEYYCPNIDENLKTNYRSVIETDYLNIILKGGIISLGFLALIAVPAIIKGIFYSKNLLSKAAGVWILLWLLSLYPSTVTTFTMSYLLVWISIGICYNKRIRNIPENFIKFYFSNETTGN